MEWTTGIRMAVRGLVRRPGFSAITVATLALGIGATATILSVVDGVMLRPLPYDDPEELVAVGVTFPEREWVEGVADLQYLAGVSHGNFADLRDRSRTLDGLAGAVHDMPGRLMFHGGTSISTIHGRAPSFSRAYDWSSPSGGRLSESTAIRPEAGRG